MIKKILLTCCFIVMFSTNSMAKVKPVDVQRQEWNEWLENLKKEMIDKGISKKTIKIAYKDDYFHEVKEVILRDKKQAEFVLTSDKYVFFSLAFTVFTISLIPSATFSNFLSSF